MFLDSINTIIHEVETHLVLDFPVPRRPMNWGIPVLQMMLVYWKVLEGDTTCYHTDIHILIFLIQIFLSFRLRQRRTKLKVPLT